VLDEADGVDAEGLLAGEVQAQLAGAIQEEATEGVPGAGGVEAAGEGLGLEHRRVPGDASRGRGGARETGLDAPAAAEVEAGVDADGDASGDAEPAAAARVVGAEIAHRGERAGLGRLRGDGALFEENDVLRVDQDAVGDAAFAGRVEGAVVARGD
jgi:hypothetical protein